MATHVPLKILLTDSVVAEHPDIKEHVEKLIKAGHTVVIDESLKQYDFIAGPNCWLLRPEVAGLFTVAVKNARVIANADQERVDKTKADKAAQRKPRKPSKARTRNTQTTFLAEPEGPSTVDSGSDIGADSEGGC